MPDDKPNEVAPVKDAADKAAAALLEKAKPEPKYTDADLEKAKADAVADAQKKADAKAAKDKAEADRLKAIADGDLAKVADDARTRAEAAEVKVRALTVDRTVRDVLADKHPDYLKAAKYIVPLVPADTSDEDLAKVVADLAMQYVDDNPRKATGSAGAPPPPARTANRLPGDGRNTRSIPPRPTSVGASRF